MSDEIGKRVAAIQAGETFMTCKGCTHWQPYSGSRGTSTVGWCIMNVYSPGASPGAYMTRQKTVNVSGVVNGTLSMSYDMSSAPMEHPVTTDLQCCSAWDEHKGA